ncbi:MAG: S-adenosylmethionine:tRNA ribosyltransferase-isomerase [Odoribacter sp.]|nr:S-adenosylmethionine:tRNA ribosyltransferase-isomerase [Odoribacter sp.]
MVLEELKNIRIENYSYELPESQIAKFPLAERESSKLLMYEDGKITEGVFREVRNVLQAGQTLIFNNTKVIYARLFFQKETGAHIEVFCLEPFQPSDYALNFATSSMKLL